MSRMDLEAAVIQALDATIAAGAGDAEAYAISETGREVRVHAGEVESLAAATGRGIGIRAWIDGQVGFSYGTDLSPDGLSVIARRAATAARIADADEFAAPPQPGGEAPKIEGLSDDSVTSWSSDRVVELALAVERTALDADDRIAGVEQTVYADSSERVAIASSTGVQGSYEASSAFSYLQAMAQGNGSTETGLGFGLARGPEGLHPREIGSEAAERALSMIGASKPPSRTCPVVLEPTVAASFAGFIGSMLGADAVQRGRSPFAERLGDEIASKALVLADDGLDSVGLGSSPFDGEGLPRSRTPLISGGKLQTFLHDSYTARRGQADSTASAGRGGYRSQPSVSASNLVVDAGKESLDGLFAAAEGGVFVTDVAGLHSGVNPVSGVFSVGASGRVISGAELGDPVREFTIASDLVSMLRAISAAGSEARWVPFGGSVRTPPLLVAEMSIGGS